MPSQCMECYGGENDGSKSSYATIMQALATGVAVINTIMAVRLANLQAEIAQDYLNIAKAWRDHYNNAYRPVEDIELSEAWDSGNPLNKYIPHHDYTIGQTRNMARQKAGYLMDVAVQGTSQYSSGLRAAKLKDELATEAFNLGAMSGLGDRIETNKQDLFDERWWKRREQTLNRGRDLTATNVQMLDLSHSIYGDLGKQAAEGAQGAAAYLMYSRYRQPTRYPAAIDVDMSTAHRRNQLPPTPHVEAYEPATTMAPGVVTTATMSGGGPKTHKTYSFDATMSGGGPKTYTADLRPGEQPSRQHSGAYDMMVP